MASVTVYSAERMQEIEDNSIVDGTVNGSGHLILTKHDSSTIDAGSVIGPTGSPGVSAADFENHLPIGMIVDYMGTTNPSSKWIKMEGQTVANAQTLYPDWWAVIPATMKSGANAIMPDTRGKVSVGYQSGDADFNTIGKVGGAKTHTLTTAEIPAHTHIQDAHDHAQDPHTHIQNAHDHAQDPHTHTGATGPQDIGHSHIAGLPGTNFLYTDTTDNADQTYAAGGDFDNMADGDMHVWPTTGGETNGSGGLHGHGFTTDPTTANNQTTVAVNQNTTANNQPTTATNQNTGGGGSHNNLQPYVVFMKITKVL